MPYQKGHPKLGGRAKGTPNKRTQDVRSVLHAAARAIGGMDRLVEWIKESPQNEYAFWTGIYPRLLPVRVMGSGPSGEIEVNHRIMPDELQKQLEERGLPSFVLGVDKPLLELQAEPEPELTQGNGHDKPNGSGGNGSSEM